MEQYRVEQFTLDEAAYRDVSDLISTAFVEGHPEGGTIAFDEQTIHLLFGSPHLPRDLFIRAVHIESGQTVGFLGGLPRKLAYAETVFSAAIPAFLAVHWQHQRKGLAIKMGFELLEASKRLGFDAGIAFFEPEAHGIKMARSVARQAGLDMREIAEIPMLMVRILDPDTASQAATVKWYEKWLFKAMAGIPTVTSSRVRGFRPGDEEALFELMADHRLHNELSILRDRDDFIWFLQQQGLNCVVHLDSEKQINGFILAWPMGLAGHGKRVPFGWVDLVHTYRLRSAEIRDLCHLLCKQAQQIGWAGLQTPKMPNFDALPFYRGRFLPYPKKLIVTLFNLNGLSLPHKVKRFYLDFR